MWYFSYGSNMNQKNMNKFCDKVNRPYIDLSSKNPKPARLEGYRLVFDVYSPRADMGAGNILKSPGDFLEGCAFDLTKEEIITIDLKEGIPNPDKKLPNRYRQLMVNLKLKDGNILKDVITYEANDFTKVNGFCPPKRWYKEEILQGAIDMGLSDTWIQLLKFIPAKEDIIYKL